MKNAVIYHCKSYTDAKDKANIYYIEAPAAIRIDQNGKAFEVATRTKVIAIFQY